MKKSILFLAAVAMSQGTFAQLTQANEPEIGDLVQMYLCDSNTVQYDAVTGSNVTWDYTGIASYAGETREIELFDATTSPFVSEFPSSVKAFSIQNLITTFYNSTATERTVQGFVYTEPTLGSIIGKWSTNEEIVLTYPFAYSSSNLDTYEGTVEAPGTGQPAFPSTGSVTSTIDGEGTMLFPNGVSVSNVIRVKTVDNGDVSTIAGTINLVRTQYEYYDLANSSLPIFLVAKITISGTSFFPTPSTQNIVLSKYQGGTVGVTANEEIKFSVYPNPANDNITITGEFQNANVSIVNTVGQVVLNEEVSSGESINVSSLKSGIYLVKMQKDGVTTVKNISIR